MIKLHLTAGTMGELVHQATELRNIFVGRVDFNVPREDAAAGIWRMYGHILTLEEFEAGRRSGIWPAPPMSESDFLSHTVVDTVGISGAFQMTGAEATRIADLLANAGAVDDQADASADSGVSIQALIRNMPEAARRDLSAAGLRGAAAGDALKEQLLGADQAPAPAGEDEDGNP